MNIQFYKSFFSSWQTKLLNEKNALAAQVKKLQRDVAKVRRLPATYGHS